MPSAQPRCPGTGLDHLETQPLSRKKVLQTEAPCTPHKFYKFFFKKELQAFERAVKRLDISCGPQAGPAEMIEKAGWSFPWAKAFLPWQEHNLIPSCHGSKLLSSHQLSEIK